MLYFPSMKKLGLITLDIDGTLTGEDHEIPEAVVDYLGYLNDQGWLISLVTGRTYTFARNITDKLQFDHYLALQNGADILTPERKHVMKNYMEKEHLLHLLSEAHEKLDVLVYAGYEHGDFCYYQADTLSPNAQKYLPKLQAYSKRPWVSVNSFDEIKEKGASLVKVIGSYSNLYPLSELVELRDHFHGSIIKDPMKTDSDLCLITHANATKGTAAMNLRELTGVTGPHIAAGDDRNDIPMLSVADKAIVMSTAPDSMHALGDVVAKPSTECGIIDALSDVIHTLELENGGVL